MGFACLLLADFGAYLGSIDVCGYVRLVGHTKMYLDRHSARSSVKSCFPFSSASGVREGLDKCS